MDLSWGSAEKLDFMRKYIPTCKHKLSDILPLGSQVQKSAIKTKGTEFYFSLTILLCQSQNLSSSHCKFCSPTQACTALLHKINTEMSAAKSLPALPTPIPQRVCDNKTNCSWSLLFLQEWVFLCLNLFPWPFCCCCCQCKQQREFLQLYQMVH